MVSRRKILGATTSMVGGVAGCTIDDGSRTTEATASSTATDQQTTPPTGSPRAAAGVVVDDRYSGDDIGARFKSARDANPDARLFTIAPGTYELSTPLDCTSDRGVRNNRIFDRSHLNLQGVTLVGKTAGQPMIDLTGTRDVKIWGGVLRGSREATPNIGVLQARNQSGAVAETHKIYSTTMIGAFETACIYNYAAEECVYIGPFLVNGIGHPVIITGENRNDVSSPYVQIATGKLSTNGFHFLGGPYIATFANDDSSACVVAEATDSLNLDQAFLASNGKTCVLIEGHPNDPGPTSITNSRFHPGPIEFNPNPEARRFSPLQGKSEMMAETAVRIEGNGKTHNLEIHQTAMQSRGPVVSQNESTLIRSLTLTGIEYIDRPGVYEPEAPEFKNVENAVIQHKYDDSLADSGETLKLGNISGPSIVHAANVTWNSADPYVWINGTRVARADLSTVVPDFQDDHRLDDGSNFAPGEMAYADMSAQVWRAVSDPENNTVSYQ